MTSFRSYWMDDNDGTQDDAPLEDPQRRLHVVSRSVPPRPRWTILYGTLGVVGVLGTLAHVGVHDPTLITVIDVAFSGILFAVLAGWVHFNRIALIRMDEPDAGTGRPRMSVIRSRKGAQASDRIARLDPDDRIILPYDFR